MVTPSWLCSKCESIQPENAMCKCGDMYRGGLCKSCGHMAHLGQRCFCGCDLTKLMGDAVSTQQSPPDKVLFTSGASSTKIPRFDYIPYEALVRLAQRFEAGVESHKEGAWNARQNPQALKDKEFLIARAAHAIDHTYKFIAKLEGIIPDDGDDDAGAIIWAGACLCAATAKPKINPVDVARKINPRIEVDKCVACGHLIHTFGTCHCGCFASTTLGE